MLCCSIHFLKKLTLWVSLFWSTYFFMERNTNTINDKKALYWKIISRYAAAQSIFENNFRASPLHELMRRRMFVFLSTFVWRILYAIMFIQKDFCIECFKVIMPVRLNCIFSNPIKRLVRIQRVQVTSFFEAEPRLSHILLCNTTCVHNR